MLIVLTLTVIASFAALRFGAESRPGFDERPAGERFGALR